MITPLEKYPELADAIGVSGLYFKREDLHPYRSHKGRSIPYMVDHYYKNGDRKFVISSSGNAALAALMHIEKYKDAQLDIFVGNHISQNKLEKLRKLAEKNIDRTKVIIRERPIQALTQAVQDGYRSLRQSTDDIALLGYQTLAEELAKDAKTKNIKAVMIGTSSGTTAQALAKYFLDKKLGIQIHIIQTSSCHPIAEMIEGYDGPDEKSIADAVVDAVAQRKDVLAKLIKQTGGHAWVATNNDIKTAQELVQKYAGVTISTNSALSVVGAMKVAYTDCIRNGSVVCIICGE